MIDTAAIQKKLDAIYLKVGSGKLKMSCDLSDKIESLKDALKPPRDPALSFEEWRHENESDVNREYDILESEYGYAMQCFQCEYVEQKYIEYLEKYEKDAQFSW